MWSNLSEVKNRFKIKSGEIEIEYEGPLKEVNERYNRVLEWVMSYKKKMPSEEEAETEKDKKSKRGGVRKAIYPPWIEKLKKDNFFKQKKSLDDVIKKFESLGAPTRGKRTAIRNALINDTRKADSSLKATKEDDTWYFMQD
jgi:hypothetical protein